MRKQSQRICEHAFLVFFKLQKKKVFCTFQLDLKFILLGESVPRWSKIIVIKKNSKLCDFQFPPNQ